MNYVFHILLNDPNSSFLNRFGNTHIFLIISLHQMMFIHSHSFIFSLPALSFLFSGSHTLSVALIISQWAVFIHCTTYQIPQVSGFLAYSLFSSLQTHSNGFKYHLYLCYSQIYAPS